jgi:hypothetical protein
MHYMLYNILYCLTLYIYAIENQIIRLAILNTQSQIKSFNIKNVFIIAIVYISIRNRSSIQYPDIYLPCFMCHVRLEWRR